jgi:ectoine hydroxylase-related dioxygenase (phytanoyl-CoA dioxygenase family)
MGSLLSEHPEERGAGVQPRLFSRKKPPSIEVFQNLCSQSQTNQDTYPLAKSVDSNIPIYDLSAFSPTEEAAVDSLQDEWHHILLSGPGVLILKHFVTDHSLLEAINKVYDHIIASEATTSKGDHFAASGKNSRIWNSLQKHAVESPSTLLPYYANPWLAHISAAWLGPAYRVTAQVNIVRPGGAAQLSHRDYHIGFQTAEAAAQFPQTMQVASQFLTLQGGVAHSDMPLESGPTRFLPFSQKFKDGFLAYRLPQFQEYFIANYVALPLALGDAVFFNPAIFHAAGENLTQNMDRKANLLQMSSAFGKTMENVDSIAVVGAVWDELRKLHQEAGLSQNVKAAVAAISEGYPFPTNLDKRPPATGGMAPESEVDVVVRGLEEGWARDRILKELEQLQQDSKA